ncbi:MAG: hypothetical protein ABEJ93_04590 [Candidatus Nanohalobium sp.]
MQLIPLAFLTALTTVFGLIAAQSKDRNLLIPAATALLLLSGLIIQTGVEYQDGYSQTQEQIDNNTTEITRNPVYTDLSTDTGYSDLNVWIGLLGIGTSLYLFFQGVIPSRSWKGKSSMEKVLGGK